MKKKLGSSSSPENKYPVLNTVNSCPHNYHGSILGNSSNNLNESNKNINNNQLQTDNSILRNSVNYDKFNKLKK